MIKIIRVLLIVFLIIPILPKTAHAAWTPPIGIPAPSFGIDNTAPTYNQNDPLHYWVQGPSSCNDSNNGGRGSPSAPGCTVPTTLAAGALVEVRGGPYNVGNNFSWTMNGTSSQPVFVRGESISSRPTFSRACSTSDVTINGTYGIVENIEFTGCLRVSMNGDYIALRNSWIHHHTTGTGSFVSMDGDNTVIYNSEINNNGNPDGSSGDRHGVFIPGNSTQHWIVDNNIHHNSGDGIQFCHSCATNGAPNDGPAYVYIGRNHLHDDHENALDIKETLGPVIISQNEMNTYRSTATSNGEPFRINDEGLQGEIWVLFNKIYDADGNCISSYNSDAGSQGRLWIIGNSLWSCLVNGVSGDGGYIVNNTIYNVTVGIAGTGSSEIRNNIIMNATTAISSGAAGCSHNLVSGGSVVSSCTNTVSADPQLINPGGGDFHILSTSPAKDVGIVSSVYQTFQTKFGISIAFDQSGIARPQNSTWDIGAYEYLSGGSPPPPPPPTPVLGDINLDHIVNSLDYSILNGQWFTSNSQSDLNSDGLVNAIDFSILNNNWLRTW